jgi:GntP family gluconate:H+ symporter
MTIEGWTQTLGAGPLLLIAAVAIGVLLFLIIRLRMHALLALILVSLATAFATGIPANQVVPVLINGFGTTLGTVALLVGLGAMLGRIVETSGGAKVLADYMIGIFGEKRAPFALGLASLIFGFPIFFDAGLVVMLPVVFAVAHRLGGGVLRYGLPAAGAFSVMHIYLPPHPGPVSASAFFEANIGLVTIAGLITAIPTWYLTAYLYGLWTGKKLHLPVPELLGHATPEAESHPPRFRTIMGLLLLPLLFIFINTGLNTLASSGALPASAKNEQWFQILRTLGETPVALLITVFVAMFVLGARRGVHNGVIENLLETSLGPVCSVILITGAGGMFGGVLRTSGIGDALADVLGNMGIPLILAGFLISSSSASPRAPPRWPLPPPPASSPPVLPPAE